MRARDYRECDFCILICPSKKVEAAYRGTAAASQGVSELTLS